MEVKMSTESNDHGRAYEYICLNVLYNKIFQKRLCKIVKNSSYNAAEKAFNAISNELKDALTLSALSMVDILFDVEPLILDEPIDMLELFLQPDSKGKDGDVRDIIMLRSNINWEIGLSIKHNHFAVKHSRLAKTLDFSGKWFGHPCTDTYWDVISNIFEYLEHMKSKGKKWAELQNKEDNVYIPLLEAFMDEINRQNMKNPDTPKKMVEYLLGEFDFYKVISLDSKMLTQIQAFNLHGTLSKSSKKRKSNIEIPVVDLPTRIVNLQFKSNSKNTVELYMNNGWQFSFRIHNASTYVETSLKFDIQIIGMPVTIVTINCPWK